MTAIEIHRASRAGYPAMAVHRFTIGTERNSGTDTAECGPYVARSLRSCAARKLARVMVEAGEPDGPIEARGTDGKLRYRVNSLHGFAKRTLVENPALRLIPYQEHPFAAVRYGVSGQSERAPATLVAAEP